ncbi:MAG: ABC transporter permease subunit [Ruminococcus sp.]|uniref:ABC transporter permease subunit n=1 Tax=Ruminococcus sp. TaxID=41978 RepID=UPI002873F2C9|nr:ABC transporter permease subunit [Ruminococcus sp.]MBQ3285332.1 ABC transporter permease subunit [Ruminococcus sp.]
MTAIIKRELSSYFNSAIGYIVLAVFTFFSGLFFYMYCLLSNTTSMSYVFLSMLMIVMLVIPIITMRSFSEERKQKTDQALLTAPISLTEMVLGKFLGAFLLYCICNAVYIIYIFIIACYASPDWAVFLTTMLGMLLMGGALIAIDLFISALTESQVIAAVISIGVGLLIYMLDSLSNLISAEWFTSILHRISFDAHFTNFINGIISLTSVVFFLSVIAIFLFLCVRVFEKRRWS